MYLLILKKLMNDFLSYAVVTNHVEHDPDIQHVPFFAISNKFFGNIYSTYKQRILLFDAASRFFVSMQ